MFLADKSDDVVVFSTPETESEPVQPSVTYGYIQLSRNLAYVQGAALAIGATVATYMLGVSSMERSGANLDDDQIFPYVYLSSLGIVALMIEMFMWSRRVNVARIALSKHKDESFVPHGAEPLPVDVESFGHASRFMKLLSFSIVAALAGASLPFASMMLASQTPSGETLSAARFMCLCSILALSASIARHLSPFITKGITVYRDGDEDRCLPLMAIVAIIAVLDAATFGAAIAAACRPLSSIAVVQRRSLRGWFALSPPPPHPGHPDSPTAPTPPMPPPPPKDIASWIGSGVRDTVLTRVPTNPLGDAERDAMCLIAAIAAVAAILWIRTMYINVTIERSLRRRVFVYVVIASALQACTHYSHYRFPTRRNRTGFPQKQGMLVGMVAPNMTVINSTANFASNVEEQAPGYAVTWKQDPMSYVISALVILAAIFNSCAFFASDVYSAM